MFIFFAFQIDKMFYDGSHTIFLQCDNRRSAFVFQIWRVYFPQFPPAKFYTKVGMNNCRHRSKMFQIQGRYKFPLNFLEERLE